ncbi:hypothetical protein FM114_13810 [Luteococcus japonicus LSP_Lj1]|uniref:Uncharacterized protein n=1 Tax=Luteococcus japonicus LSP_Lj1 TaxID=1255658 RepID=A0A1R4KEV8_9ACTN|nr:hypothetical protein FM114_13810 [Luteococcus japonicus LSP_Lj1]
MWCPHAECDAAVVGERAHSIQVRLLSHENPTFRARHLRIHRRGQTTGRWNRSSSVRVCAKSQNS